MVDGEPRYFEGTRFDGASTRPIPVFLSVAAAGLRIEPRPAAPLEPADGGGETRGFGDGRDEARGDEARGDEARGDEARGDEARGDEDLFWPYVQLDQRRLELRGGRIAVYRVGDAAGYVECGDPGFIEELRTLLPRAGAFASPFSRLTSSRARIALSVGGGLALLVLVYIFGVPAIGDFAGRRMPPALERSIGEKVAAAAMAKVRVVRGPSLESGFGVLVEKLGLRGGIRPVLVDDGKTKNAFAIMGGRVLVYAGLVRIVQDPGELQALLAHEYAHVEKRHSARLLMRGLAAYFVVSWFMGDPSGLSAAVLQNVDQLRFLRFSREMEEEADARAAELLEAHGVDPGKLASLLSRLEAASPGQRRIGFLSSHPATERRIAAASSRRLAARPAAEPDRMEELAFAWIKDAAAR